MDLSRNGDRSKIQSFQDANAIHTFFNRRPPRVQVIVDVALTQGAHASLARTYHHLSEILTWFVRPPDIEISHRRTVLTFVADSEMALMAIAYLASWPFKDNKAVRTALFEFVEAESATPVTGGLSQGLITQLKETLASLHGSDSEAQRQPLEQSSFFTAPIQVRLSNTSGQGLELYHNPRFGVRNFPLAQGVFPVQPRQDPFPHLEDYRAFVAGFRDPMTSP